MEVLEQYMEVRGIITAVHGNTVEVRGIPFKVCGIPLKVCGIPLEVRDFPWKYFITWRYILPLYKHVLNLA